MKELSVIVLTALMTAVGIGHHHAAYLLAGNSPAALQTDWYPWQKIGECSKVELFISQSRLEAGGSVRKIRLRARNQNDSAIDLKVTPRITTNTAQEMSLEVKSLRLSPRADIIPANAQWEAPAPAAGPATRVVSWGIESVEVKKEDGTITNCVVKAVPTATAAISNTLRELGKVTVSGDEVPPSAREKLSELKDRLRQLILDATNHQSNPTLDPEIVSSLVTEMLQLDEVTIGASGPAYGAIQAIKIEQPKNDSSFLAASIVFGLPGSDDNVFYLLRKMQDVWQPSLIIESRAYDKVKDALGPIRYALSSAAGNQQPFVVIADVVPRGVAEGRSIRHRVFALSADGSAPSLVEEGRESYCGPEGKDPAFSLFSDADKVVIRYSDGSSVGAVKNQPTIKYAFADNRIAKVTSLEDSARSFIDEWVGLDSKEQATRWIEPIATEIVQCRWAALKEANFKSSAQPNSVRVCPSNPCWFQMEITRSDPRTPHLYFTVVRKADGFYVQHINQVKPVRCDLLAR